MQYELKTVFDSLTAIQRRTAQYLAQDLTSKEIAIREGITHAGANRRIEKLRDKTGLLANDIRREYRDYLDCAQRDAAGTDDAAQLPPYGRSAGGNADATFVPWHESPLPDDALTAQSRQRSHEDELVFGDAMPFAIETPWGIIRKGGTEPHVVPEVLEGGNALRNRVIATIAIAIGLAIAMLVVLAVSQALGELT